MASFCCWTKNSTVAFSSTSDNMLTVDSVTVCPVTEQRGLIVNKAQHEQTKQEGITIIGSVIVSYSNKIHRLVVMSGEACIQRSDSTQDLQCRLQRQADGILLWLYNTCNILLIVHNTYAMTIVGFLFVCNILDVHSTPDPLPPLPIGKCLCCTKNGIGQFHF